MPTVWEYDNEKVAVTKEELIPAFFNTWNTLKSDIYRNRHLDNYGIKKLTPRACYRTPVLIDYDTLPREIQQELGDPRKPQHIMEQFYRTDRETIEFFTKYRFENGKRLEEKYQNQYITNASVLIAVDAFKTAHVSKVTRLGKKPKHLYQWMANEAQGFQNTLEQYHGGIRHTLPASERHFRRVYDAFFSSVPDAAYNYVAVISGKHMTENSKKIRDREMEVLDALFARAGSKPNMAMVADKFGAFLRGEARVFNADSGEVYDPKEFNELSTRAITGWLSRWESRLATHALRSGNRQIYMGQYDVAHARTRAQYSGSKWSIDDRQPPFEYAPGQRLWLYNGMCTSSQAITVTVYGKSKEGMILDFYRETLRTYTIRGLYLPAELEAEVSLNASFKDTFLQKGRMFDYVNLIANNARSKYIERINRDFRLIHEKELEGWIGRPFARDESNQIRPVDGLYAKKKYRAYDSLVKQSLKVIEDWNNMPHPNFPDMSRWDYFIENQNPNLHATNWQAILPYLGHDTKTSCNVGVINLNGKQHWLGMDDKILTGDELIGAMRQIEGQQVHVKWLDDYQGNVLKGLVYLNDTYVCEAVEIPRYNEARIEQTEQDHKHIELQNRYANTIRGFMKERKSDIPEVVFEDLRQKTLNDTFRMYDSSFYYAQDDNAQDDIAQGGIIPGMGDDYEAAEIINTDEYGEEEPVYVPKSWEKRY